MKKYNFIKLHLIYNLTVLGSGDSKKTAQKPVSVETSKIEQPSDNTSYKNDEYFNYNQMSYYQLEGIMEKHRLKAVNSNRKFPYAHAETP